MLAKAILVGWLGQWKEHNKGVYSNTVSVKVWKKGETKFEKYRIVVFQDGDKLSNVCGFKDLVYVEGRLSRNKEDVEVLVDEFRVLKKFVEEIKEEKETKKEDLPIENGEGVIDEEVPF